MDVIRNHPDWCVIISRDSFGLHVNIINTHRIFAESRIYAVKEEGDTLHVNQSYYHKVARDEKNICIQLLMQLVLL